LSPHDGEQVRVKQITETTQIDAICAPKKGCVRFEE
jgi:hypothetical protein